MGLTERLYQFREWVSRGEPADVGRRRRVGLVRSLRAAGKASFASGGNDSWAAWPIAGLWWWIRGLPPEPENVSTVRADERAGTPPDGE